MRCPLADRHDWDIVDDDSETGYHLECVDCDTVYMPYIGTVPLDLSPFGYLSDMEQ